MGTVEATARAFAGSGLARSVVEKDRCAAKSSPEGQEKIGLETKALLRRLH